MPCCICGPAGACEACTRGGHLRWLADNDPRYREFLRSRWTGTPAPPAAVDPVALAIDLCPHRKSCQCREPIACAHPDRPGDVTLSDCRRCQSA